MPNYNPYAPKPLNLAGQNDRLAMLLDMGVSPGEDDSYDVQANKLLAQKDKLIDRSKLNILQRIESAIQTARNGGAPEGPLNPVDFATETLAKTIPSPSELDINRISRDIPAMGQGILDVASHPLSSLKQAALNGPPDPTTVASALLPGAALNAYRELVPLAARTYLHHMAGVPTPFSHVTETERAALTEMAQNKIDHLLQVQQNMDKIKAMALKNINDIKLMKPAELMEYAKDNMGENEFDYLMGLDIFKSKGPYKNSESYFDINKLRDHLVQEYKDEHPSIFANDLSLKAGGYIGSEEQNANVRKDFQNLTGKQLRGFQVYPDDYSTALGKTYVEPMIDKTTGRIVPKSIKDTYKFYPDVYSYDKGQGLRQLKYLFKTEDWEKEIGMNFLDRLLMNTKMALSPNSTEPLGILARKLGMRRPTSIIDIPLQAPAPINAYDKAAILLGAKSLADKKE